MKLDIYQVDAFADALFKGNPAAVVPLQEWLPDDIMQSVAMENNLSETAFFVPDSEDFQIRWFTPASEVILCGHATLATAHVLYSELGFNRNMIRFNSKSGLLTVERKDDMLQLNFPADFVKPCHLPTEIVSGIKSAPMEAYKGKTDYLLVFPSEEAIIAINPDHSFLKQTDARGIIVTAPGNSVDFVSRFFAPGVGIDEDPVTGSAHTLLVPYWAKRLAKPELSALQLSKRGGSLWCTLKEDRVLIAGKAITYLRGTIEI